MTLCNNCGLSADKYILEGLSRCPNCNYNYTETLKLTSRDAFDKIKNIYEKTEGQFDLSVMLYEYLMKKEASFHKVTTEKQKKEEDKHGSNTKK